MVRCVMCLIPLASARRFERGSGARRPAPPDHFSATITRACNGIAVPSTRVCRNPARSSIARSVAALRGRPLPIAIRYMPKYASPIGSAPRVPDIGSASSSTPPSGNAACTARSSSAARASSWSCTTRTSVIRSAPAGSGSAMKSPPNARMRSARPCSTKRSRARAATLGRSNVIARSAGWRRAAAIAKPPSPPPTSSRQR